MPDCNDLISGLNPACAALNKVGGVDKRVWIGSKNNILTSTNSAGYVNSITMANVGSIPSKLYKFIGKRDKNNGTFAMTAGENVNTFNHTVALALYYSNPTQLEAIQQLCNADDLVVFVQENSDAIRVFGLDKGMSATAGEGGTGTLLNDSTAYTVTLSGEQRVMPQYFSVNGEIATLASNIAYLDAISSSI